MMKKNFQDKLLGWYQKEARDLPWRHDLNPYKIWISEIMLQQTRVDTVIPYFKRFIAKAPTIKALAEIREDDLLKLWQGLGYYNRAINLKKAAQIIMERFEGHLPYNRKDLESLPGIGAYTSGAIASIAFGQKTPAVDGNVLRVLARITANLNNITDQNGKKQIQEFAKRLLPSEKVGDFNQALIELGAVICLPNGEPKCKECPVNSFCCALQKGIVLKIPVKSNKKKRKIQKKTVLLISWGERFALLKRQDKGLLPNLWELPNMEGHLTEEECKKEIKKLGLILQKITYMKPSKHIFTHLEWQMTGYHIRVREVKKPSSWTWATKAEIIDEYSVPTAFKDFIEF